MKRLLIIILLIYGLNSSAEDFYELYKKGRLDSRELAVKVYTSGNNKQFKEFLSKQIVPSKQYRQVKKNIELASIMKFLELADQVKLGKELAGWILSDEERFFEFAYLISPKDDLKKVAEITEQLYKHDTQNRDEFSNLIFAFAVVWDQKRPLIHNFMGNKLPAFKESLTERYDLLKNIYQKRSPIKYSSLNSKMLTYAVDLPLPISEIRWAHENEKGRSTSWGRKFLQIKYDEPRFNRNQFSWNSGDYTFANIRNSGGICIDQAYYTAMTARCWGIPSMIFTGKGRRGGHAWLGLMRTSTKWTMDIGRYNRDNYSSGKARNPQTNQLINDHELALMVSPELASDDYLKAVKLNTLGQFFEEQNNLNAALDSYVAAAREEPLYEEPWNKIIEIYIKNKNWEEAMNILKKQASAFSRYEDKLIAIYNKQVEVLEKMGRQRDADYIRKGLLIKMRKRDDLLAEASATRAEEFIAAGNKDEARDVYEKYIRSNAREGYKILEFVESYVEMMQRTEQLDKCAQFLKSMVRRVPDNSKGWMEGFLLEAYEKNGDTKEAEKLKENMKKSKKDIDL